MSHKKAESSIIRSHHIDHVVTMVENSREPRLQGAVVSCFTNTVCVFHFSLMQFGITSASGICQRNGVAINVMLILDAFNKGKCSSIANYMFKERCVQ